MALLTAGTAATTTLKTLLWKPSGMNATDLAALNALILNPLVGSSQKQKAYIENNRLYLPDGRAGLQGIEIKNGDYIAVDIGGWPIVIPNQTFAGSWVHS